MSFEERVSDWASRLESILIEMVSETTDDGVLIGVNIWTIANAFEDEIKYMACARQANKFAMRSGSYKE